jgi:hypothetical protein
MKGVIKNMTKCYVDYKKVKYDELISSSLTGWGNKTIQMHYVDKQIFETDVLKLLQELRIISGINYRKYLSINSNCNTEFLYINTLIDNFIKDNNIKNFSK